MHEILKFVKRLDWTLLLAILAISILSLMIIASATHANNGQYSFVIKQSVFLLVGLCGQPGVIGHCKVCWYQCTGGTALDSDWAVYFAAV